VAGAIAGASIVEIDGGMVLFPDQMLDIFAVTALAFLAREYPCKVAD